MTAPLSLPPSCTLWVNGARFADGSTPGEVDTDPVALTDLRVVWGRENTVDQPSPATLSCRVQDVGAGKRFVDVLAIGARVEVRADAVIYPDPTVSTFLDPGFEAGAVGATPSHTGDNVGSVTVTNRWARTGTKSAAIQPADAGRRVRVIFPPAPFSAAHDPAAWDAIPRTLAGTTWSYGASLRRTTDRTYPQVRPVLFTQPWPGTERVLNAVADVVSVGPAPGTWLVTSGRIVPPADCWVGICVEVYPTGPSWDAFGSTISWDSLDPAVSWDDYATVWVDDVTVLAPAAGAGRAGAVFSGRITDLVAGYDETIGATMVDVTAQDDTAELANRYAGAEVWPQESLLARFNRIVAAAAQPGLTGTVASTVRTKSTTWRDISEQPALSLLQELATSIGGVLWSATSLTTGAYLELEDVNARPALQTLTRGADLVVRIVPAVPARGVTIDACDIELAPVRWRQDATDDSTRVTATWLEQLVVDGVTRPTSRTVVAVNPTQETNTGRREVGVSTVFTSSANATTTAEALLGRLTAGGWRVSGLSWDASVTDQLDGAHIAAMMQILDGTTRLGLPIMLTGVPDWSPVPAESSVPLFLEGSTLTNTDGAWTLDLVVSSAAGQGAGRLPWDSLDATWQWDQFDPAITWDSLRGVGQ